MSVLGELLEVFCPFPCPGRAQRVAGVPVGQLGGSRVKRFFLSKRSSFPDKFEAKRMIIRFSVDILVDSNNSQKLNKKLQDIQLPQTKKHDDFCNAAPV